MHTHNFTHDYKAMTQGKKTFNILIVEDDRLELAYLKGHIQSLGHHVHQAVDGLEALSFLKENPGKADIILMDRIMPNMDGLKAIYEIKNTLKLNQIPIVMITGSSKAEDLRKGIDVGVFYYLNKPVDEEVLNSVLIAAVHEVEKERALSEELIKHSKSFQLMDYAKFQCQTPQESEAISAFMAHSFPLPEKALQGLSELIMNAVEHGNLKIGCAEKQKLIRQNNWKNEIRKRLMIAENKNKKVTIIFSRKEDGVYAVITDEGDGFNWRKYITIDPSRASAPSGRGIARAVNACFDRVNFNESGNQVVAYMAYENVLKW